jgi:predicted permease
MDSLFQDLRHGLRLFRARPAFTTVAVLTLAVGIGASTAIFSAVSALLMRPLPIAQADRVLFGLALREGVDPFGTSLLEYAAYRDSSTLASAGVASQRTFTLIGRDDPERVEAAAVTASYLETLRVTPVVGRTLTPRDDRPDAAPVAVIAYDLWQRRFQGAPAVAGTTITLDDGVYTIVGVMPRGFDMPAESEIWVPLRAAIETAPLDERAQHAYAMVARLAPGVTLQQADTDLKRIARQLEDEYPRQQRGWTYQLIPLRQQLLGDLAGRNRQAMIALEAAVGFLLLICCANVANLLLVRGVSRQPEIAVRRALGASRGRVVRQLLAESTCLALAGGAAGLLLAVWLTPAVALLNPIRPASLSTFLTDFAIDGRVMLFAVAVSMLTGVVFGIVPALKAARVGDAMVLLRRREQGGGGAGGRRWLGAVVVVEVAVAVILLVNGSLVVQSFSQLQDLSLGFDPQRLLTLQMTMNAQKYPAASDRAAFVDRVIAQVAAVPGVISAGISTNIPLQHLSQDAAFTVEGRAPANPADVPITAHRLVTPAYLQTLGVRLVKGRLLNEHDRAGAAPVVVISEALAKEAWPNEDPIGRRIRRGRVLDTQFPWLTVVGVVADVKEDRFNFRIDRPAWYLPYAQQTSAPGALSLVVRTSGDPLATGSAVRTAIRSIDRQQSVSSMTTMTNQVADVLVTERFTAVLMTMLASVGLLLAAFGLYGVVAYSSTQRTVEIGLRMALGAKSRDVMRLVIGQVASLVALGLGVGWVCARASSVMLAGTLYGVDADDPATFAVVTIVLAAVGLAACYVPARRATRLDPMTALRAD